MSASSDEILLKLLSGQPKPLSLHFRHYKAELAGQPVDYHHIKSLIERKLVRGVDHRGNVDWMISITNVDLTKDGHDAANPKANWGRVSAIFAGVSAAASIITLIVVVILHHR